MAERNYRFYARAEQLKRELLGLLVGLVFWTAGLALLFS